MRKLHLIGIVLVAIFALSAIIASTASAVEFLLAAWLLGTVEAAAELPASTTGELLFENTSNGVDFVCSYVLDGFIGPGSLDLITKLLSLAGVEIGQELSGAGLVCSSPSCEKVEIWAEKLPWPTEVELEHVSGVPWILVFGAQYEILCQVLGVDVVELCTAAEGMGMPASNGFTGVEVASGTEVTPLANCGSGTENSKLVAVGNSVETSPEGVLSISE